ncbi:MAG: 50S ribosomal protein L35 [Candidatus Paceibacterota bacterium]|jgi:large subunit ribosomal protein L35|nr:50S ribosomal protein L35 [Candidatus Paceibacterota bacterium]MDD4830633.1 50S ribosomal protein L35 [Candidatus Paceibacterota bacterium]MDD4875177.1 50S ribosomal protein L35 [Candidatus Paceibacterota bacterium]
MANKPKTRKAIIKRFKITKTGKILRRASGQNHLLSKRSSQKKRSLRKWVEVSPSETKKIKRVLTY